MNEKVVLELCNVSKKYGKKKVLNDISFQIEKGEVVGLIGRNGAGKSTIMGIITRLIPTYDGIVHVNGRSLSNVDSNKKNIGAMIENSCFFGNLSGLDNLKYCASVSNNKLDMNLISHYSELLEMQEVLKNKVKTYSVGMKKKLDFLQAINGMPDILILDEPTSGMDPQMIFQVNDIMVDVKKRGTAIFVSSHQLSEISKVCDRIILVDKGNIIETLGTTDEAELEKVYFEKVIKRDKTNT